MNKQEILNHLQTKVPYTGKNPKKAYLVSEWWKFDKKNLSIMQEIKAESLPELEIDEKKSLLRLKRFLFEKNFVKCK